MFTEDNLCHHMPIKHIISMFVQKISKTFENMVLLNGSLPIFSKLNLHIGQFIYVRRHDCAMNMAVL